MAVSRLKCNKLMMMLKEVEGLRHKEFGSEAFSWSGIELPGYGIKFDLREFREIGALGEILA